MQKYNGQNLEGRHKYVIEPGFAIWAPEKNCIFCKKCDDLIWDYTNGPYCFFCNEDADGSKDLTERGAIGECEYFEEKYDEIDKQNLDLERQEEEIREFKKKVKTDPEYKKIYDELAKQMMDCILYGRNLTDIRQIDLGRSLQYELYQYRGQGWKDTLDQSKEY